MTDRASTANNVRNWKPTPATGQVWNLLGECCTLTVRRKARADDILLRGSAYWHLAEGGSVAERAGTLPGMTFVTAAPGVFDRSFSQPPSRPGWRYIHFGWTFGKAIDCDRVALFAWPDGTWEVTNLRTLRAARKGFCGGPFPLLAAQGAAERASRRLTNHPS